MKKIMMILSLVCFGSVYAVRENLEDLIVPGATEYDSEMIDPSMLHDDDEIIYQAPSKSQKVVAKPVQEDRSYLERILGPEEYEVYENYALNKNRMGYFKDAAQAIYYNKIKPHFTKSREFIPGEGVVAAELKPEFTIGDADSDDELDEELN